MVKCPLNLYIDYNVKQLTKLWQNKDPDNNSISALVESFLRDFFEANIDIKKEQEQQLKNDILEYERELAVKKAKLDELKKMKDIKEQKEKEYYKEFGMKKKDARIIKGDPNDYIY